jgi:hypothetical protein
MNGCADLSKDLANCGMCGNACPKTAMCLSGKCVCPNNTPTICGNLCVDLTGDPNNCGMCGTSCGLGVCVSGMCQCKQNQIMCNKACVDPQTDPSNCGMCGTVCNKMQKCVMGQCM